MTPPRPRTSERDLPPAMREALAVVRELRAITRDAGIRTSDPLRPVVDALASAVVQVAIDRQAVADGVSSCTKTELRMKRALATRTGTPGSIGIMSASSCLARFSKHRILCACAGGCILLVALVTLGWQLRAGADRGIPAWVADLAAWNGPPADLLDACRRQSSARFEQGRRTCWIWIDPPPR
jgi:hypothetical protein